MEIDEGGQPLAGPEVRQALDDGQTDPEGVGLVAGEARCGESGCESIKANMLDLGLWLKEEANVTDEQLYEILVPFVHKIYFGHLLVNPKDRRAVVVDQLLGPIQFKQVLSRVLFRHFEVLSVLFAPSHLMPMFALGIQTGMVLDVGYNEATLIPVYEGVPILKCWQAQPLAAKAIHKGVKGLLKERATVKVMGGTEEKKLSEVDGIDILEETLEDIKGDVHDKH